MPHFVSIIYLVGYAALLSAWGNENSADDEQNPIQA